MLLSGSEARGQGFSIGDFQVLSSNRVGRTTWDFVIRAAITNNLVAAQGISAYVLSSSPGVIPLENVLTIGDLASRGSIISTDTVTIRQDRVFPFDPSTLRWFFSVESMPLTVNIISPQAGVLTNGDTIVVTGTVGPGVDNVLVGRTAATLDGTNFTATAILEEGRNTISALATNSYGGAGSVNVSVTRDSTPPLINIEAPASGAVLDTRQITVTGMVNDIVPGTVNPEQVTVMVNGLPAMVANRSYAIPDVLLAPGRNFITVMARDKAGNASQRQIEVTYVNPASQKRLVRLAGDAQTAMVSSVLPQPLVVEFVDANGVVQTNQPITFTVTRNDGLISTPPTTSRTLSLLTDYQGQAQVFFQLGTRTGAGNHQVEVTSPGVAAPAYFCANATGSPPARVSALIPETQVGEVGKPLPKPWTAFVTDEQGNPVRDVPIVFMVFQGEGRFAGTTLVNTNTDSDGRASVVFTLGPEEGINNNTVVAIVPGVTNSSATFTASGMKAQAVKDTRISGLVLDHANRPMSNVACRVIGTFNFFFTDTQGQFVISNAPVGAIRLFVDARNRGYPGEWHYLDFDMVTIAGRDNRLDRPIYMLQLDTDSQVEVGGNQDVTLHLKGIPGSSLTVFANSVRDQYGNPVVTNLTWTQVNAERIPMAPPLGSQPAFTSAIQPANLRFNPPARMCIPNYGAPPGQILEMFSFDHDIGSFVSVGTATVSANGSQICSDPGFGVVKSGWHPIPPPPPLCTAACSPVPEDTECERVFRTGFDPCNCPTWRKEPAKFHITTIKVDGNVFRIPVITCTNKPLSFSVDVEQNACASPIMFEWTFGDGETATGQSVSHAFKRSGNFNVRVKATCPECPTVSDDESQEVTAVKIERIEIVSGATPIKDGPNTPDDTDISAIIVNTKDVIARAVLNPAVSEHLIPDSLIKWTGGEAADDSKLMRKLPAQDWVKQTLSASCGDSTAKLIVYFVGAIPTGVTRLGEYSLDNARRDELLPLGILGPRSSDGLFSTGIEIEFTIAPQELIRDASDGIFDKSQIDWDVSRDKKAHFWIREFGAWRLESGDRGSVWEPDDDYDDEEDNNPWNGHGRLYASDNPFGLGLGDWFVKKLNMREFVKVGFAGASGRNGSICSEYQYWHAFRSIRLDVGGWVADDTYDNELEEGNRFWGSEPSIAP